MKDNIYFRLTEDAILEAMVQLIRDNNGLSDADEVLSAKIYFEEPTSTISLGGGNKITINLDIDVDGESDES